MAAGQPNLFAPSGKPVRSLATPGTWYGNLWVWRYLILRRVSQGTVLLLFFATVRWGWRIASRPVLTGNLSSSELFGLLPMADPFAVLQLLVTRHLLAPEVLLGAVVILGVYVVLAGRTFCAWICPVNMVTDLAAWLRCKLGVNDRLPLRYEVRYGVLVLTLLVSAITGVAAFEWISPIAILHRELIYGIGLGWVVVLGVFLLDVLMMKRGWCGHLCPLGAFYAVLGRYTAQLRICYDAETCTHCGECIKVCPEPQVLNLKQAAEIGMVISGECSNCGSCTSVCPEDSLGFGWRWFGPRQRQLSHSTTMQGRTT
jgi:ferredoxin-type protein NapH